MEQPWPRKNYEYGEVRDELPSGKGTTMQTLEMSSIFKKASQGETNFWEEACLSRYFPVWQEPLEANSYLHPLGELQSDLTSFT